MDLLRRTVQPFTLKFTSAVFFFRFSDFPSLYLKFLVCAFFSKITCSISTKLGTKDQWVIWLKKAPQKTKTLLKQNPMFALLLEYKHPTRIPSTEMLN